MAIGPVQIEGKTFYWGRSAASGYPTRLFSDIGDALAELHWLDEKWELVQQLWDELFETEAQMAAELTRESMEEVMAAYARGMRPVEREDRIDQEFYRSEGPGEEPRIAIVRGGCPVMEVDGASPSDHTVQDALARFKGYS